MSEMFRKQAMAKLNTPERGDEVVSIVRLVDWLFLVIFIIGAAILIAWGFMGRIANRVPAQGMVMTQNAEVFGVLSSADGQITEFKVRKGQQIQKDEVVALVAQEETSQRVISQRADVDSQALALKNLRQSTKNEESISLQNNTNTIKRMNEELALASKNLDILKNRMTNEEQLVKEKVIVASQLEQTKQNYNQLLSNYNQIAGRLEEIKLSELRNKGQAEQQITQAEQRLQQAQAQLRESELRLKQTATIKSPVAGIVTEVSGSQGQLVRQGTNLLRVATDGKGLEVLSFVGSDVGKKVQKGQRVLVEMSKATKEDLGRVEGIVTDISDFPVSKSAIEKQVGSEELAQALTKEGPPYSVKVQLVEDSNTASGYKWTSQKAKDVVITSGTVVNAEIEVEHRAPITLVMPTLRKWLKIYE